MATPRMHADEVDTDAQLVRRLLAAQFPEWAGLRLDAVHPRGTDHALYRVGHDLVVRLPRREQNATSLAKERRWLPLLAPHVPLAVPTPVADGTPGEGYPFEWAVYTWLEGETATAERIRDLRQAARDLAELVAALQAIEATDAPPPGEHNVFRGEPLARRDAAVRRSLVALRGEIDTEAARAVWERALRAPEWRGAPVWIHGDLDSRNMLVRDGRLSGVIDFGCLGAGDPACDVMVAWKMLTAETRGIFREALHVDDATWERAHGWALSQAVGALSYYTLETNAVLVREGERWLAEVLADAES